MKKTLFTTYVDIQYETLHTIFLSNLNKYAHRKEKVFISGVFFMHVFDSFTKEMGEAITKNTRFRNDCLKHEIEESYLAHKTL